MTLHCSGDTPPSKSLGYPLCRQLPGVTPEVGRILIEIRFIKFRLNTRITIITSLKTSHGSASLPHNPGQFSSSAARIGWLPTAAYHPGTRLTGTRRRPTSQYATLLGAPSPAWGWHPHTHRTALRNQGEQWRTSLNDAEMAERAWACQFYSRGEIPPWLREW